MAQKTLTAKVRLVTTDAEKALDRLAKKIQSLESKINKISNNNNLEKQLNKQATATEKVNRKLTSITDKVKKWASGQKQVNSLTSGTNSILGSVASKLRRIASIYFGIMGAKYAINATDTITKAENKLNYLSAGQLGSSGYSADGSYSEKTLAMTQNAMDKMYASSQKVRMGYGAMMSNVSKMMTLAPDAFQGNTDAAIRFQEIMAESYALGGASADEMSTSMYQLTQALGAGTLAGDELRSVREGAPLAYKAIEEFAQGLYNTDESLKELGADGKITSDIVVAAIMKMGDKADEAFAQTTQTFEQTWDQIKNAALYAFDPVGDKLREVLTKAVDNGLIQKIETAFNVVANTILWVLDIIETGIEWIADNWEKIKPIIVGVLSVIISTILVLGAISVATAIQTAIAWIATNAPLLIVILSLSIIIYMFYLVMTGAMSMTQFLVGCFVIIGVALLAIGALIGSIPMMIIGAVLIIGGLILQYLDYFLAVLYSIGASIWNIFVTLATTIIKGVLLPFVTVWDMFANFLGNLFNDPVAAIIRNFEILADSVLSILQTIATGIDSIFGTNLASGVQGWRNGLSSWADKAIDKYGNGTYEETSGIKDKVFNVIDSVQTELLWDTSDAWNTGMSHGSSVHERLNGLGSGLQGLTEGFSLDGLTDKLGFNTKFPSISDPAYDIADAYQRPDDSELLGNIDDNTKMTADDLKYLRDVANMEWKKEFTTAEIHVEMNNNNNVNGDSDLDGLVTKLTTKLYEELDAVANGVYA